VEKNFHPIKWVIKVLIDQGLKLRSTMSIDAMKITLKLAAIYNVAWGSIAILLPIQSFEVLGMPPP
jgi:hypothetical protein